MAVKDSTSPSRWTSTAEPLGPCADSTRAPAKPSSSTFAVKLCLPPGPAVDVVAARSLSFTSYGASASALSLPGAVSVNPGTDTAIETRGDAGSVGRTLKVGDVLSAGSVTVVSPPAKVPPVTV